MNNKNEKGVTFAEVLTVVAILLIIAGGYSQLFSATRQAGVQSLAKKLHSSLLLARGEAMRLGQPAGVCRSEKGSSSCSNSINWQDGWTVFTDLNNDSNMSNNETVRFYRDVPFGYSIQWGHANKPLMFDSRGRSGLAGEFKICSIDHKSSLLVAEESEDGGDDDAGDVVNNDNVIRPIVVISVTVGGQIYKENRKGTCE